MYHKNIGINKNHVAHNFEFIDQADREAYISISPINDKYRVALQLDTMELYVLIDPINMIQKKFEIWSAPEFQSYAIMTNPLAGASISNGGYRVTSSGTYGYGVANSNISVTTGKYYFEIQATCQHQTSIGFARYPVTQNYSTGLGCFLGSVSWVGVMISGQQAPYYTSSDIIGFALDLDDKHEITLYKNNIILSTTDISGYIGTTFYVAVQDTSGINNSYTETFDLRFRPEQMTYAPPAKFPAGFGIYL